MASRDQEDELAFRQFVAQAGVWAEPVPPDGEPAPTDGHLLEALLAWWGGLRFPVADRRP
jgi:hypothetical protein